MNPNLFGDRPQVDGAEAVVEWAFRINVGPDCSLAETPAWGDRLTFAYSPLTIEGVAKLVGHHFLETLLLASGAEPVKASDGVYVGVKGYRIRLGVEKSDD